MCFLYKGRFWRPNKNNNNNKQGFCCLAFNKEPNPLEYKILDICLAFFKIFHFFSMYWIDYLVFAPFSLTFRTLPWFFWHPFSCYGFHRVFILLFGLLHCCSLSLQILCIVVVLLLCHAFNSTFWNLVVGWKVDVALAWFLSYLTDEHLN